MLRRSYRFKLGRAILFIGLYLLPILCLKAQGIPGAEDLAMEVRKWNEAHNNDDQQYFLQTYAPKFVYYGSKTRVNNATSDKITALKKLPDFKLFITSNIKITQYPLGRFYCEFTKEARYSGKVKKYPSYLVFKQNELGSWQIIEEGDYVTNRMIGYNPNYGKQIATASLPYPIRGEESNEVNAKNEPGNSHREIILIVIIVGIFLWLTYKVVRRKSKTALSNGDNNLINPESSNQFEIDEQKLKGNQFEEYITDIFKANRLFKFEDWRGDKGKKGNTPRSSEYPDLEYSYVHDPNNPISIAVECKYRSRTNKIDVELCKPYQLKNYKQYSKDKGVPVFLFLGYGGEPSMPDELYIISLNAIRPKLSYSHIQQYRLRRKTFFFMPDKMEFALGYVEIN